MAFCLAGLALLAYMAAGLVHCLHRHNPAHPAKGCALCYSVEQPACGSTPAICLARQLRRAFRPVRCQPAMLPHRLPLSISLRAPPLA